METKFVVASLTMSNAIAFESHEDAKKFKKLFPHKDECYDIAEVPADALDIDSFKIRDVSSLEEAIIILNKSLE